MLQYNNIPHLNDSKLLGQPVFAFNKYDGSNLRFEWSPKRGFYKFGTRHQMMDHTHDQFGDSIRLFQETVAPELLERLGEAYHLKKLERVTAFCEYFGPNSFAGWHDPVDPKELKLIDVAIYKQGLMGPKEFIDTFIGAAFMPGVVYYGNLNQPFIERVKNDTEQLNEGVVCKAQVGKQVLMTKIKTKRWLERLKAKFPKEWEKLV